MAAETATQQPGETAPPCPDPSAHEKGNQLSAAASTAALYATHPEKNPNNTRESPLGADGKLSSKGAATSLKYAQAQDLPSFPSRGAEFTAANTAALLAKDHKMKDLWYPESSVAGSKAALLAHRDQGKLDLWQPSASAAGNSAAMLAMRNKGLSPQLDRGGTDAGRNSSLLAATMSHNMGRQRAGSMPTAVQPKYPDSQNSGKNALSAATASHRASVRSSDGWNSPANQAARIKHAHLDRELFTEDPHLQTQQEIDDQKHQAALHASAASFAKSLYVVQKRGEVDPETSSLHDDDDNAGAAGAQTAHRRNPSTLSQPNIREEAIRYIHLQDTAHKLAQERLAKVDKDMEPGRYREYYGYPNKSPRKSRLSMRPGGRKRASSEGQYAGDSSDDELQARRIRAQMSQLSTGVATVSDKQRQEDRARLLAAAEKRVHAQMHDMDEKVFMDTGKPTQAMMDEWESKAREKAERDRVDRDRNPGKTHIGGGKYMDDADINAIAAARLKPTLDELNDTAEKKRARDEEMRVERDRVEAARMEEKMKDRETKAEFKRIREQDKATAKREKEERKAAERAEKEQARARKSEDKRKSREQKRDDVAAVAGGATLAEVADNVKDDNEPVAAPVVEEPKQRQVQPAPEKEKEKSGRGMFDRIANRLKKHGDERKSAEEGWTTQPDVEEDKHDEGAAVAGVAVLGMGAAAGTGLAEEHVSEKDTTALPDADEHHDEVIAAPGIVTADAIPAAGDVHDEQHIQETASPSRDLLDERREDDAPLPGATAIDTGAAAPGGIETEHAPVSATAVDPDVSDEDEENVGDYTTGKRVAATAGIAALGGIIAAGALGAGRRRKQEGEPEEEVEERDEISDLSTEDDEPTRPELRQIASAEHSGQYTFAAPALGPTTRPDLERHISTIQDSASDADDADDESGELADSEDEDLYSRPTEARRVEEVPSTHIERSEEVPDRDRALVIDPTPMPQVEDTVAPKEQPFAAADTQTETAPPLVPLSQMPRDEQGNIIVVNKDAPRDAPHLTIADRGPAATAVDTAPREVAADTAPAAVAAPMSVLVDEQSAPAPAVKTGPRVDQDIKEKQPETEKDKDKESKGVRGFFSKLRGKSKAENKLHKEPPAGETRQKPEAAATTASEPQKDTIITPITTTSAGLEAEGQAQQYGTDGPIGDPKLISGVGGEPQAKDISDVPPTSADREADNSAGFIVGGGGDFDNRAASPSSFRRYDEAAAPRKELDEVSSSGADEDDYARGRAGKLMKRIGLAKGKGAPANDKTVKEPEVERSTSNGEETEQFEEARDHFDESLAPPPAFAGQAKTESPNRTTRFQEQL